MAKARSTAKPTTSVKPTKPAKVAKPAKPAKPATKSASTAAVPRTEGWRAPAALPTHVPVEGDEAADALLRAYGAGTPVDMNAVVALVQRGGDALASHALAMLEGGALDLGALTYDHAYADSLAGRERKPYDALSNQIFHAQQARIGWLRTYCQLAANHPASEPRLLEITFDTSLPLDPRVAAAGALAGWRIWRTEQRPFPTATPSTLRALHRLVDDDSDQLRLFGVVALLFTSEGELASRMTRALDENDSATVLAFVGSFAYTQLPFPASAHALLARCLAFPDAIALSLRLMTKLPLTPEIVAAVKAFALSGQPNLVTMPDATRLLLASDDPSLGPALAALLDLDGALFDAIIARLDTLDDPASADALAAFIVAFRKRWKKAKHMMNKADEVVAKLRRPR